MFPEVARRSSDVNLDAHAGGQERSYLAAFLEAWMRRSSRYQWRPAAIEIGQRGCHIFVIRARVAAPVTSQDRRSIGRRRRSARMARADDPMFGPSANHRSRQREPRHSMDDRRPARLERGTVVISGSPDRMM